MVRAKRKKQRAEVSEQQAVSMLEVGGALRFRLEAAIRPLCQYSIVPFFYSDS